MNVGILSMQKIHNYGSFLQALSLKKQLEERGHNVYFIDILPGKQIASNPAVQGGSILSKFDRYFFKRIENYLLGKKMAKIHIDDYQKYLETEKSLPSGQSFDLVIIGSDEVFNATAPSPWGFTTQLFGDVDNAKRVVTYAASCGSTTLESAEKYGITEELRGAMQRLEQISVRDANTADFVTGILGTMPERHVDPVFISSFDEHIPTLPERKPYLLVYAYANRIDDPREIAAIKAYAKKNNLDILCVGMQQRWCTHNISANAFELLAYVKNATCVVTDTFHGTVFSIKYNKKFVSLIRESNKNKLGGLLDQFSLLSRSVDALDRFEEIMDAPMNYSATNEKIKGEQQRSYDYLDGIVQAEE